MKNPFVRRSTDVTDVRWRGDLVEYHGPGREYVYRGRRVVVGKWPAARPEECKDASDQGEWIAGGKVLVCRGCGLDCT
jgi:hypothetical protein